MVILPLKRKVFFFFLFYFSQFLATLQSRIQNDANANSNAVVKSLKNIARISREKKKNL